jgi:hypothetical protein
MNILLGDLKVGEYREVSGQEYEKLLELLQQKRELDNE